MINVMQFMETANGCFDFDFDVYDSYDERCQIAYTPVGLTCEGTQHFKKALDLKVQGFYQNGIYGVCNLVVECNNEDEAQACADFFYSAAGYCSSKDYEKWFVELD